MQITLIATLALIATLCVVALVPTLCVGTHILDAPRPPAAICL